MDTEDNKMEVSIRSKRLYTKRVGEFNNVEIPQLLKMASDLGDELSALNREIKKITDPDQLKNSQEKKKDLTNKRVRIYSRLRALGHSCKNEKRKKPVQLPQVQNNG